MRLRCGVRDRNENLFVLSSILNMEDLHAVRSWHCTLNVSGRKGAGGVESKGRPMIISTFPRQTEPVKEVVKCVHVGEVGEV